MKAMVLNEYGNAEFQFTELPQPSLRPDMSWCASPQPV